MPSRSRLTGMRSPAMVSFLMGSGVSGDHKGLTDHGGWDNHIMMPVVIRFARSQRDPYHRRWIFSALSKLDRSRVRAHPALRAKARV